MRIVVRQETIYHYATPAKSVIQTLRLTPRSHDGQHVIRWRIDIDRDVRMTESEDAFGNITHAFHATGPIDAISLRVEGEVETHDRAGVVRDSIEPFPPSLYLRATPLTEADAAIRDLANGLAPSTLPDLDYCHTLMAKIHEMMSLAPDTEAVMGAQSAMATARARAADMAHVFLACARLRRIPSRFIAGHVLDPDIETAHAASHAWAEAHIAGLGWVGFDCAKDICPTDAHVRVAMGLDHLGAAPIRGARHGGDGEYLDIKTDVRELFGDRQAQRQQQG